MRKRLTELLEDARMEYYTYSDELHEEGIPVKESVEEYVADYLLKNGVIVPPCKMGDEVNNEVVCQIEYTETLGFKGNIHKEKYVHTCDKDATEKVIYTSHIMTWEEAEQALKGGGE